MAISKQVRSKAGRLLRTKRGRVGTVRVYPARFCHRGVAVDQNREHRCSCGNNWVRDVSETVSASVLAVLVDATLNQAEEIHGDKPGLSWYQQREGTGHGRPTKHSMDVDRLPAFGSSILCF